MSDARRAGIAVLVLVLAGAVLLHLARLGSVRIAGVGLAWWYAGLVAPLLAALVAIVVVAAGRDGRRLGLAAVAVWLGPAVATTLTARGFGGGSAATLALVVCSASLLALLARPSGAAVGADPVTGAVTCAAVGIVLCAHFTALADLGRSLGVVPWATAALAAAAAMVQTTWKPGCWDRPRPALVGGAAVVAGALAAVGTASGIPPWAAWRAVAERPVLAFSETGSSVEAGVTVMVPTALLFSEPHRVTAMAPGVVRVVEHDAEQPVVREWRLGAGEAVTLRPGDELGAAPGARLRFEGGRRVPGAPPSGAAWADPGTPERDGVLGTLGLIVALAGGALALAPAREASVGRGEASLAAAVAALAPMVLLSWGVYAAWAGVDLTLAAPAAATVLRLPAATLRPPWSLVVAAMAALGIALLSAGAAAALRARFTEAAAPWTRAAARNRAQAAWIAVIAAAGAAASLSRDAWELLLWGAAAAAAAAAASMPDEGPGPRVLGAVAGAGSLLALAFAGLPPERSALIGVGLAWASAQVAARARD